MRYTVEFEIRSEFHETVSESVRKALVSTFGSVDKFSIVPCREYIGYIQGNEPIIWHEVGRPGRNIGMTTPQEVVAAWRSVERAANELSAYLEPGLFYSDRASFDQLVERQNEAYAEYVRVLTGWAKKHR